MHLAILIVSSGTAAVDATTIGAAVASPVARQVLVLDRARGRAPRRTRRICDELGDDRVRYLRLRPRADWLTTALRELGGTGWSNLLVLPRGTLLMPGVLSVLAPLVAADPASPLTFRVVRLEERVGRYRVGEASWTGGVFDLPGPWLAAREPSARPFLPDPGRSVFPRACLEAVPPASEVGRAVCGAAGWIRHYDRSCAVSTVPSSGLGRRHWSPAFEDLDRAVAWAFEVQRERSPYLGELAGLLDEAGHNVRVPEVARG